MQKTIQNLVSILSNSKDKVSASKEISRVHKFLSPHSARILILDLEDFTKGNISESEFSLFLQHKGFR